ncbi:MAG: EAL domain-containing protein, partial [Alphaproteobacteria bacterium]|nr:EAL domain-containing protein [Alphaproteobacteria bacterium]
MQHLFLIIGYVVLSLAVGVALPALTSAFSIAEGLITALLLSGIGGLIHENFHRRAQFSQQTRHLLLLKKAYDKTKIDILDIRNDMISGEDLKKMGNDSEDLGQGRLGNAQDRKSQPRKSPARPRAADAPDVPEFLTSDHDDEDGQEAHDIAEEKASHWLDEIDAQDMAEEGHESTASEAYEDDYEGYEEYDEYDEEGYYEEEDDDIANAPSQQETEIQRREALAREIEVLQTLVDKLYSEGLPDGVKARMGIESPDDLEDDTPRLKPDVGLEETLLPMVREALEAKRLDAHLQPIHTLPQRKRRFFEAFGRIRSKDGELLVPERIKKILDEDELHPAADTLLLYRCAQILKQNGGLEFDRAIFCNVSPATLTDVTFLRDFSEYMEKRRTLARSLVLELDHATIDPVLDDLREPIRRLAGIGLRFALDDVRDISSLDPMALG